MSVLNPASFCCFCLYFVLFLVEVECFSRAKFNCIRPYYVCNKNEISLQKPRSGLSTIKAVSDPVLSSELATPSRRKKLMKRWLTGVSLGALGTFWICSGNGPFTFGFLCASLIAQNEYYDMVRATGVIPAFKTGVISSLACYFTATFFPAQHEIVMPLSSSFLMLWLLVFNKKSASISEISTSLLGMFYIGYLPSFWVRLRAISDILPTLFPAFLPSCSWMQPSQWSIGAIMTWWTWTSIVVADVSAYFIGKNFGKHKLSAVSSAAGSASPNKTIEGAVGGFFCCTLFSMLGAYLMQWPLWAPLGAVYGLTLSFIALVGDLTASMMKRDAGIKDTGNILPGHGGLLDRIDSYMFTAPVAYFFCKQLVTFIKA